jgi:hypothetical protein
MSIWILESAAVTVARISSAAPLLACLRFAADQAPASFAFPEMTAFHRFFADTGHSRLPV